MRYRLQWKVYRRPFRAPIESAHGTWRVREGVIVRLESADGKVGLGEVAPLPDFGTETLAEALQVLRGLHVHAEESEWMQACSGSPCCEFAIGSALWMMNANSTHVRWPNTALLPAGEVGIDCWHEARAQGYTRAKWKMGMAAVETEWQWLSKLPAELTTDCKLRLDANCGLTAEELEIWGKYLVGWPGLDFLEQPFMPGDEAEMAAFRTATGLEIALDESVVAISENWMESVVEQWQGPVVLKAALLGDPRLIAKRWSGSQRRLVLSSTFETAIGWWALLQLAEALHPVDPIGGGVLDAFDDDHTVLRPGPVLSGLDLTFERLEAIWNTL